jgi:hypothetical protein
LSDNGQWRVIVLTVQSGLKYEENFERKTDVYVKLMVITFVSGDMVLLVVSVIDRK